MNTLDRNPDGSYHIHCRDKGIVIAHGHLPNAATGTAYLRTLADRIDVAEALANNDKAGR